MKTRLRLSMSVVLCVLLTAGSTIAQSQDASSNPVELREKIQRMEGMDIRRMAPSTLEIYQRTLLRFYEEYVRVLQEQIDLLAPNRSSPRNRSAEAVQTRDKLIQEKAQIGDNISIVRMSLGLPDNRSAVANLRARRTSESAPAPTANPTSSFAHAIVPMVSAPMASTPSDDAPSPTASLTTTPSTTAPGAAPSTTVAPATVSPTTLSPATAAPAVTATAAPAPAAACDYVPAPILKDTVERLARGILVNPGTSEEKAQQIDAQNYKLVFYTIADALEVQVKTPLPANPPPPNQPVALRDLEPYRYLGETLRTDKQLSSSASSAASVSAIDKPGFAWLLGLGIENGLVEKNVRDTVLTLSSSPAALYMLNRSAANPYQDAGFLNRIGISASFNIANQDQLLANATRSQLREYSIKYRFAGDRSARSKKLEAIWDSVAKDIQQRLLVLNNAADYISKDPILKPLAEKTNNELQAAVVALISSNAFKADADANGAISKKQTDALGDLILCYLFRNVYSQKDRLSPAAAKQFRQILVPNLIAAQLNLKVVREAFNLRVSEFFKGPLGTAAYFNHREPVLGNYSEFKILFEHPTPLLRPIGMQKLTLNAGYSFYHHPNLALKQEKTRDYSAALSFEGSVASPFTETADLGRITYSFVGRYERLLENSRLQGRKGDLASLQFLMDFPLFKGMAFPFSLTYSNATTLDKRSGWHANFSFKLDTDKLLELVRATSGR